MEYGSGEKENTFIARFYVDNKPFYVKVLWKDDDHDLFHIMVFYENFSWIGKYSSELAAKRRERLDETVDNYKMNVRECLSGNSNDYVYDFIQNDTEENNANFIWKKRYENALKIHGLVPLVREEVATSKDLLIDNLLTKNKKCFSDIEIANKAYNNLLLEMNEYKNKLEELIESKSSLEETLYGRFVQVLNKKKDRIQILEEHINNL